MFGLFGSPDLTLRERALLLLTLVQGSLLGYVKHGQWLAEEHRATIINNWLKRGGRKASVMFRARISKVGDDLSRSLVVNLDQADIESLFATLMAAEKTRPGESPELDGTIVKLLDECERALIANNLAS